MTDDEKLYEELKVLLKKFKHTPPTGHGSTSIEMEVEVDWQYGEITMVRVTTKNRPKPKKSS
jgi:hypothetical protein